MQLQNIIKSNELNYETRSAKNYNFSKYSSSILFLRDIHDGNLTSINSKEEQSKLINQRRGIKKGVKPVEKGFF